MARQKKAKHEDHVAHEAWVVPYADLMTLLLAFFVVMYAMSSINEGKYKIMATHMRTAFGGEPRTVAPVQVGETQVSGSDHDRPSPPLSGAMAQPTSAVSLPRLDRTASNSSAYAKEQAARAQLSQLSDRIRIALDDLVKRRLVNIRHKPDFIEVEIQSDILFASGSAQPSPLALSTTKRIGAILAHEDNAIRVAGYTDNVPIRTAVFGSNWELSASRAASIVHELMGAGVAGDQLSIAAFGEHHPIGDNATVEGRNRNRRVLLVVMARGALPSPADGTVTPEQLAAPARGGNTSELLTGQAAVDDASPTAG
jgi:chemotaxis protein MotB